FDGAPIPPFLAAACPEVTNDAPEKDARVLWLIKEIGGRRALAHRFEDIRRQRWGRWQGNSYRTVQISGLTSLESGEEGNEEVLGRQVERTYSLLEERDDPHHDRDVRRAWIGLLAIASKQFKAQEDVSRLLYVLAHDDEVQAGFTSEWP